MTVRIHPSANQTQIGIQPTIRCIALGRTSTRLTKPVASNCSASSSSVRRWSWVSIWSSAETADRSGLAYAVIRGILGGWAWTSHNH